MPNYLVRWLFGYFFRTLLCKHANTHKANRLHYLATRSVGKDTKHPLSQLLPSDKVSV